ncbi:MAG: hypothetical protein ACLP0J_10980 [Solirubrobacteraceae bacterium]|jgi:hypothetical protein
MSYTDALARITQIEQQLSQLSGAATAPAASTDGTSAATDASAGSGSDVSATSFADALAQAQATSSTDGALSTLTGSDTADAGLALPSASSTPTLASATGGLGVSASGSATLPSAATTLLTTDQQQFASRLAADTGLNPGVVSAWMLAEENGSAAQSRQAAGNNDWLNIGYTGAGTYGSSDSVWSDPVTAADATAGWLEGQNTVPGYGTASSGIQSILSSVGQTPAAQMSALQTSGWAGSGYPDLPSIYAEVTA